MTDHADEARAGPAQTGHPARAYSGRALLVLALIGVLVLGLDLLTKQLAVALLADHGPVRLLGGTVYLVLTRNSGAAFSLAQDYTFVFPLVTAVVVGWIGWLAWRLRSVPWAVALGLVLGGALGNFVDRLFRAPGPFLGHVVDFVSLFDDHGQVWPVFNVADMSLVSGVCLAVLLELKGRRRDGTRAVDHAEEPTTPGPVATEPAAVTPGDDRA